MLAQVVIGIGLILIAGVYASGQGSIILREIVNFAFVLLFLVTAILATFYFVFNNKSHPGDKSRRRSDWQNSQELSFERPSVNTVTPERRVVKTIPPHRRLATESVFTQMEGRVDALNLELQRLHQELEKEEPYLSERSRARAELLQSAITQRSAQLSSYLSDIYARKVQVWLHEVETFVRTQINSHRDFTLQHLIQQVELFTDKGYELMEAHTDLPCQGNVAHANALIPVAIAKMIDVHETLRDRQVLQVVEPSSESCKLDLKLDTQAWLHWLHDAMPLLEHVSQSLEPETSLDDASKVRGQLRMQQNTVATP